MEEIIGESTLPTVQMSLFPAPSAQWQIKRSSTGQEWHTCDFTIARSISPKVYLDFAVLKNLAEASKQPGKCSSTIQQQKWVWRLLDSTFQDSTTSANWSRISKNFGKFVKRRSTKLGSKCSPLSQVRSLKLSFLCSPWGSTKCWWNS